MLTNRSCTDGGKALAKKKLSETTEDEKTLKGELQVSAGNMKSDQRLTLMQQGIVRRIFKQLTGIRTTRKKSGEKAPIPRPPCPGADPRLDASGMELLTPLFMEDVSHPANTKVLDKVVDMPVAEINVSLS
jgi:hypothetical protein